MADVKTITLKNWYPFRFVVDVDDDTGEEQAIDLLIRRFDVEQGKAFNAGWVRLNNPPHLRAFYRKVEDDEQLKHTIKVGNTELEAFVLDDDEITRRRISEMSDEARVAFEQQREADRAAEVALLTKTITEHMRVAPGQRVTFVIEREGVDEPETVVVKTGADLARVFGGQVTKLAALGWAIHNENMLTGAVKKAWRSRSASSISSSASPKAASGERPDAAAAPAASEGSAATAAAMASSEMSPSGSTVM